MPSIMEVGQADRIRIQLDRHDEPREALVRRANVKSQEVEVEYPGTSLGPMFTDIRETIDIDDVVEVLD